MPLPVSLREVVGEIDAVLEAWTPYINRVTGEILTLPDEASDVADEFEEDLARVAASDDFIVLPGKFEIHEYRVMQSFVEDCQSDKVRAALGRAIEGRGAFRRFKDLAQDLGVVEQWYRSKERQIGDIAAAFLQENEIAYKDDLAESLKP